MILNVLQYDAHGSNADTSWNAKMLNRYQKRNKCRSPKKTTRTHKNSVLTNIKEGSTKRKSKLRSPSSTYRVFRVQAL